MNTTNDMVRDEADQHYAALGLTRGSVEDLSEVKRACNRAIVTGHTDAGGTDAIAARINVAYDWLKKSVEDNPNFFTFERLRCSSVRQSDPFSQWRQERQRSQHQQEDVEASADDTEDPDTSDGSDAADMNSAWDNCFYSGASKTKTADFINDYLRNRGLKINARGMFVPVAGYKTYPEHPVGEVLRDVEITEDRVQMELQDYFERQTKPSGAEVSKSSLKSGLHVVVNEHLDEERAQILERVMVPISAEEKNEADRLWSLLAVTMFDDPPAIVIAGLKKIIHQVKRKALRIEVGDHLMVVFYSQIGDTGKTRLAFLLTSPLEELRSRSTPFSDVVDKSNIGLFSQPIVLLDDIDKLDDKCVGTLKSVISSDYIDRRRFFKQSMGHVRQQSVFIGTANCPIQELMRDSSGHHRFLMLTFKTAARRDLQKMWDKVNKLDWELLWRSVDQDDPDPIVPVLGFINRRDADLEANSPEGQLRNWIRHLNLSHPDVEALSKGKQKKYYRILELYPYYTKERGERVNLSRTDFDRVLTECCQRGVGPFARINPHTAFGRAFEPKP